jgi:Leucine Rich repeat
MLKDDRVELFNYNVRIGIPIDECDVLVDLIVESHSLGDYALMFPVAEYIMKLEVDQMSNAIGFRRIILSDADLGAYSLNPISLMLRHHGRHLVELDLSHNHITITNDVEAHDFEQFLSEFRKLPHVRRLNLSGNRLGQRAFEILTRVYLREDRLEKDICQLFNSGVDDLVFRLKKGLGLTVGALNKSPLAGFKSVEERIEYDRQQKINVEQEGEGGGVKGM